MSERPTLESRIVELESLVTHIQYDLERMNEVILAQNRDIEALRKTVQRLSVRLDALLEEQQGDELAKLDEH